MFNIDKYRSDYHHDFVTVISHLLPREICAELRERVNDIIDKGLVTPDDSQDAGNSPVSDMGVGHFHYVFKGDDIRNYLPGLKAVYHALLPLVSMVTRSDVIVSPYPRSDINIKVYPPGSDAGGLYDTNGIAVLLFLTTNKEAPLRIQIPRSDPSEKEGWIERKNIYAEEGSILIMRAREILHDCEPTITEQKMMIVLNFYKRDDIWRPSQYHSLTYSDVESEGGKHLPMKKQDALEENSLA